MKNVIVLLLALVIIKPASSQTIAQKLAKAVQQLEADPQMKHAIVSLCVMDVKTGKQVYGHHEQIGLAPASTQKIFTSAAAFELLGKDYRYKTQLAYYGTIKDSILDGCLYILGSGDPTLGSWRYSATKDFLLLGNWLAAVKKLKARVIDGLVITNSNGFSEQPVPRGWIWEDIGNYYGAPANMINWRENQYDIVLKSGSKIGDPVGIIEIKPSYFAPYQYTNNLLSAAKGTGDNAYIFNRGGGIFLLEGTIPVGENKFTISGSLPQASSFLIDDFEKQLSGNNIQITWPRLTYRIANWGLDRVKDSLTILYTHYSPLLDSINYWFLRKSVNLYGEALLKTIAFEKTGFGSMEKGVELVKDFWRKNGIDEAAVNIIDGSGLSPQNRVTTDAAIKVLQYAKTRSWFNAFYKAMPEYNGMKMKSGSIGGARAYAGYHTAKDGNQYIFSIIINNYDGSAGAIVQKMYKVLDVLK